MAERAIDTVRRSVCLSKEQADFVDKAAEICDVSRSEYIRDLVDSDMRFRSGRIVRWILGMMDARWKE